MTEPSPTQNDLLPRRALAGRTALLTALLLSAVALAGVPQVAAHENCGYVIGATGSLACARGSIDVDYPSCSVWTYDAFGDALYKCEFRIYWSFTGSTAVAGTTTATVSGSHGHHTDSCPTTAGSCTRSGVLTYTDYASYPCDWLTASASISVATAAIPGSAYDYHADSHTWIPYGC